MFLYQQPRLASKYLKQIAWRRAKIVELKDACKFKNEYPGDAGGSVRAER